jgi:hypothetical protein
LSHPELRKQFYYVVQIPSAFQRLNHPPQYEITLMFLGPVCDKQRQIGAIRDIRDTVRSQFMLYFRKTTQIKIKRLRKISEY